MSYLLSFSKITLLHILHLRFTVHCHRLTLVIKFFIFCVNYIFVGMSFSISTIVMSCRIYSFVGFHKSRSDERHRERIMHFNTEGEMEMQHTVIGHDVRMIESLSNLRLRRQAQNGLLCEFGKLSVSFSGAWSGMGPFPQGLVSPESIWKMRFSVLAPVSRRENGEIGGDVGDAEYPFKLYAAEYMG